MEKKSRASSQRDRRVEKKRRSTKVQMSLEEAKARLRSQAKAKQLDDSEIDFSDIPELTDSQLKRMKRVGPGRPPIGDEPRKMISIKLDQHLLANLKAEAEKSGKPYQSLIHEILQKYFKRRAA